MLEEPKWNRTETIYSPSPRNVPLSVRLVMLFGGFNSQMGWFAFGLGMMGVWVFIGSAMFYNMVFLSGNLAVADGKITAVVGTNISSDVDGRVYSYHYGYLVESVSYTGNSNGYGGGYNVNDSVVIEYALNSPSRSRLRDLPRIKPIDPVMVLVFVMFPLIGLGFIIPCIRKGLKGARLLRSGKQCIGERVKKESTFRENNNKVVYKYTFTFKANGGQSYLVSAKTHEAHLFAGEGAFYENTRQNNRNSFQELTNESIKAPLLYNPKNPNDAILLDDLPGRPRFNENGRIREIKFEAIPSLIIPGFSIIGHTLWFLHVLKIL